MILSDAVVKVIRDALSDYESATGLECQIRYADRLSAKVEMALEVAEAVPDVIQINQPIVTPYVTYTSEPQTENQTETESTAPAPAHNTKPVDKAQIHEMLRAGVTVSEIAEKLGVGVSTVYKEKKYLRDLEAK